MSMTQLETIVRTGLTDLADEVRPVDLTARVAATRRRRRARRRVLAIGVGAVVTGAVGAVVLWPSPAAERQQVATETETVTESWLPTEIDLSTAVPVATDASLRLLFQTAGADGIVRSYGLVAGSNEVVALPDLPVLPALTDPDAVVEPPAQLSADGARVLLHMTAASELLNPAPQVVDTRTGAITTVPWRSGYRAAALSPDGRSLAVTTLSADVGPLCGPDQERPCPGPSGSSGSTAPWELTIVDLETGTERGVSLPETLGLVGSSANQFTWPPTWSTDGRTIVVGVSAGDVYDGLTYLAVPVDGAAALVLAEPYAGQAPWSPDSTQLLTHGSSSTYLVVTADPASAEFGELIDSGPVLGRNLLGWSGADRLLWFDRSSGALVETDLRGAAVGSPTLVRSDAAVAAVQLAPSTG